MKNQTYFYDEYFKDVSELAERYKDIPNPHIVGIYKDSLPFAVHLSNVMKCPLSIVNVQENNAEWLINLTENVDIRPERCKQFFPKLMVLSAVYNDGDQFKMIKQLPEFVQNPDYSFFSLFGCDNEHQVYYKYEQVCKNIVLPWHQATNLASDLVIND